MARIRTIKPEFWTSEQVMGCSMNARLLFIGLWNFCDDAGRMPASDKRIKASVFPSDDFLSEDIRRMIDELSSNGLILLYVVDGKEYLQVTGWHHQKIDRPQTSKIPDPPIDPETLSPTDRRTFDVGREGNGRERKGRESGSGGPTYAPAREAPAQHEAIAEPAQAVAEVPAAAPPPQWNSRENFDRVEQRCRPLVPAKWLNDPVVSPMARLEADGLDLECEIVPAILDLAAAPRPPIRTWSLLAKLVAERVQAQRDRRTGQGLPATPPAPTPPENLVDLGVHGRYDEATLRLAIVRWRESGSWIDGAFGPPPGEQGCRVPSRLLIGEVA